MSDVSKLTYDEVAQLERIPGNTYRVTTETPFVYVQIPMDDWRVVLTAIAERPALIAMARRTADAEVKAKRQDEINCELFTALSQVTEIFGLEMPLRPVDNLSAQIRQSKLSSDRSLADAEATIAKLTGQVAKLRAALETVKKGRGQYSTDNYEFACNVIKEAKTVADAVLAETAPDASAPADVGAPAAEADRYAEGLEAAARIADGYLREAINARWAFRENCCKEIIDAIRAEIKARGDGPGDGWCRDMSRAPKDGTAVDLWFRGIGRFVDCFFDCTWSDPRGRWKSPMGAPLAEPEAWMLSPLPPPPAAQDGEDGT